VRISRSVFAFYSLPLIAAALPYPALRRSVQARRASPHGPLALWHIGLELLHDAHWLLRCAPHQSPSARRPPNW
jgi:hypothetical protein